MRDPKGRFKGTGSRQWDNERVRTVPSRGAQDGAPKGRPVQAKVDKLGRRLPEHRPVTNAEIKLPKPSEWYVQYTDHPKRGLELRCHLCGQWFHDYRTGFFQRVTFTAGHQRVRTANIKAGDRTGGHKTRRTALWAMHVIKSEDFVFAHQQSHGRYRQSWTGLGWPIRDLRSDERVSPSPGHRVADPLDWQTTWKRWVKVGKKLYVWEPTLKRYRRPDHPELIYCDPGPDAKPCTRVPFERAAVLVRQLEESKHRKSLSQKAKTEEIPF